LVRDSRFLAGTMAMTTFLFLRITHDPLELPREAVTRGEPRIRPFDQDPGAGLFPLAWACPTAISRPPHHLRRLAPAEFSDD